MKHQDFQMVNCRSANRDTTDLWDILVGGMLYTTIRGKEKAAKVCIALNKDPYYLERGQDRRSRGGATNYERA